MRLARASTCPHFPPKSTATHLQQLWRRHLALLALGLRDERLRRAATRLRLGRAAGASVARVHQLSEQLRQGLLLRRREAALGGQDRRGARDDRKVEVVGADEHVCEVGSASRRVEQQPRRVGQHLTRLPAQLLRLRHLRAVLKGRGSVTDGGGGDANRQLGLFTAEDGRGQALRGSA
eukprot:3006981-Pleurochrysis_carterae.AAC.2